MPHFFYLILCTSLLVACGPKNELSTQGSAAQLSGADQGQRLAEKPRDSNETEPNSRLRIVCESSSQMLLTHSDSYLEDRSSQFLDFVEGKDRSPTILMANRARSQVIHADMGMSSERGMKLLLSEYDYATRRETKRQELGFLERSADFQVFESLHLPAPKFAVRSPEGSFFALRKANSYSLRLSANPTQEISSWQLNAWNLRWDQDWIFADQIQNGNIRQILARVNANKQLETQSFPAPSAILGSKAEQLGLRRLDAERVIWLEWLNGSAVLRLLEQRSQKVFDLRLPDEADFSPAFAIHKLSNGRLFLVLQTLDALHFYRFNSGKLVLDHKLPYPKKVKERIEAKQFQWFPGELYSPDEKNLFVVLPEIWGRHLFAVDEANSFRRLGYYECLNADFLEEK
jgi:hypothetical protein